MFAEVQAYRLCPDQSEDLRMKPDSFELAMLPAAQLLECPDPGERYGAGKEVAGPYRQAFNAGIRGYQVYTYLLLVERYFGEDVQAEVLEHQLAVFGRLDAGFSSLGLALELIQQALATNGVNVRTGSGEIRVPLEVNIALVLLLHLPQSPDCVPAPAGREASIRNMHPGVEWSFAGCLRLAGEDVVRTWSSLLACFDLYPDPGEGLWSLIQRTAKVH